MMKYRKNEYQVSEVQELPAEFEPKSRMKRLTIDVPADLHTAIKVDCARRGAKMADVIREILESQFGKGS
ncbi:MAG: plasmid partition protein ParG [Nitrospirota bacterium]